LWYSDKQLCLCVATGYTITCFLVIRLGRAVTPQLPDLTVISIPAASQPRRHLYHTTTSSSSALPDYLVFPRRAIIHIAHAPPRPDPLSYVPPNLTIIHPVHVIIIVCLTSLSYQRHPTLHVIICPDHAIILPPQHLPDLAIIHVASTPT
jgi:hypothetical protein